MISLYVDTIKNIYLFETLLTIDIIHHSSHVIKRIIGYKSIITLRYTLGFKNIIQKIVLLKLNMLKSLSFIFYKQIFMF